MVAFEAAVLRGHPAAGSIRTAVLAPHAPAVAVLPFDEVYRRHAAGVYRFCLSQLGDAALAEDVAADTFTSAWAAYPRVQPDEAGLRPWLYRIARNATIDVHRRRLRGGRAIRALGEQAAVPGDVETAVAQRAELRAVIAAIAALPRRDRVLVGLRIAAGLSFADVGATLRISEQAAKIATHRALGRVRRQVAMETDR